MIHFSIGANTKKLLALFVFLMPLLLIAQTAKEPVFYPQNRNGVLVIAILTFLTVLGFVTFLYLRIQKLLQQYKENKQGKQTDKMKKYIDNLNSNQIEKILEIRRTTLTGGGNNVKSLLVFLIGSVIQISPSFAQDKVPAANASLLSEAGIMITILLLLIPILAGIVLMYVKISRMLKKQQNEMLLKEAEALAQQLREMPEEDLRKSLESRMAALNYKLSGTELRGESPARDARGIIGKVDHESSVLPFVAVKKKSMIRPGVDPGLSKLVIWYIGCAAFWLIFGTTVGEYLGIKFVAPDVDTVSWLSFGRLRPVHTNAVFWGWASLGMLGLGFYIVPTVSNVKLYSYKWAWISLVLINASVVLGSLFLMAGINNGGGEYREYIWPVQLLFAIAIIITLLNYTRTIARRTTKEIYISNWYIVAAVIFAIVITIIAYLPQWQNGLGETIIQGYYMHQGVGMWFMMFTLGIVYYLLPQQLNVPIYSYSLGILAFWTQILFYTLIGTHHFVFSSIPWWLQTTAIVGSAGMIIPVVAGSTNFILTFKGGWHKVAGSYTLPFFLVGIIFYFTGSLQGTAEAFRTTNLIWHFTDFTVAHSHLTMYGIITFFIWAGAYAVIPRLTGKEPPQITIGAHFWLALIGMMFYTVPLMYGSTLRGLMWIEGKPFIDSVSHMAPYWLWRAIGGSLMWIAHLFFGYNIYKMVYKYNTVDVSETAILKLKNI